MTFDIEASVFGSGPKTTKTSQARKESEAKVGHKVTLKPKPHFLQGMGKTGDRP